jgi:hypothetical protein
VNSELVGDRDQPPANAVAKCPGRLRLLDPGERIFKYIVSRFIKRAPRVVFLIANRGTACRDRAILAGYEHLSAIVLSGSVAPLLSRGAAIRLLHLWSE